MVNLEPIYILSCSNLIFCLLILFYILYNEGVEQLYPNLSFLWSVW